MWGLAPALRAFGKDLGFLPLAMGACGFLFLASIFAVQGSGAEGILGRLTPTRAGLVLFGASGAIPVFEYGRWWTILSAGWLHGGWLHIFFNLLWLRNLVPSVSELYGPARLVIIYSAANVMGFAASSFAGQFLRFLPRPFWGAGFTVGASAAIFGLLGALYHYGRRTGSTSIGNQARVLSLVMLVFGFLMPLVDNWAHIGGWLGGYLAAMKLDPLKAERVDHLLMALALLGATALSIVASFWTARSLLP